MIRPMISRARLKLLRSLGRRSARVDEGLYLVEGRRLVEEAIRSGAPVDEVLVTEAFWETEAGLRSVELAVDTALQVTTIRTQDLERVADTRTPQGIMAVIRRTAPDPDALAAPGLHLVFDGLSDPGNAGTLVRAADAFGVASVLAGPGSVDFESGKTLRAAMGSTFHLPLLRTNDLVADLRRLVQEGAIVVAGTTGGDDIYRRPPTGDRIFLVLGNEAHGISAPVLDAVSGEVRVPCPGRAESLNVAMAGAILLSVLSRQAE